MTEQINYKHKVRVTFADGRTVISDISYTLDEFSKQYIGEPVITNLYDNMQLIESIEFWDGEIWQQHKRKAV